MHALLLLSRGLLPREVAPVGTRGAPPTEMHAPHRARAPLLAPQQRIFRRPALPRDTVDAWVPPPRFPRRIPSAVVLRQALFLGLGKGAGEVHGHDAVLDRFWCARLPLLAPHQHGLERADEHGQASTGRRARAAQ